MSQSGAKVKRAASKRVTKRAAKPRKASKPKKTPPPTTTPPAALVPADVTRQAAEQLHKEISLNPLIFGLIFLKEHFSDKSPKFHLQILKDAMKYRYYVCGAPRGSAKSTILIFLRSFHAAIFQQRRFIVIVANTYKKAAEPLDAIKRELKDNQVIKDSFPNLEITRDAEGDSIIRHPNGYETRILCKGKDQIGSIRGVKFRAYRPDLILVDDLEDDKSVESPDLRLELKNHFDQALIPAGDPKKCWYLMVGTILHDDSQLAHMLNPSEYPEWFKRLYRAHIDYGKATERSLWAERWTVERLRWLMKNDPLVYAKEYQNDPVAGSQQRFHKEDFRYWKSEHNQVILLDDQNGISNTYSLSDCRAAISCDLAWSEKKQADDCVIMSGLLTPANDILIDWYLNEKGVRPDTIWETLFSLEAKLRSWTNASVPIGFEKAMLEQVTKYLLRQQMRERGHFLLFKELTWDRDKIKRIEIPLVPRYSQHTIYHRHGQGDLEHQLVRFPSAAHDDLPDALQGLIQLLQYPKQFRKEVSEDDQFTKLMKWNQSQSKPKRRGLFNLKQRSRIPVTISPLE